MLAFNAAGPEGLIDGKAPGKVPLLHAEQRAALRRIIEAGPNPAVDGGVRWRLADLPHDHQDKAWLTPITGFQTEMAGG